MWQTPFQDSLDVGKCSWVGVGCPTGATGTYTNLVPRFPFCLHKSRKPFFQMESCPSFNTPSLKAPPGHPGASAEGEVRLRCQQSLQATPSPWEMLSGSGAKTGQSWSEPEAAVLLSAPAGGTEPQPPLCSAGQSLGTSGILPLWGTLLRTSDYGNNGTPGSPSSGLCPLPYSAPTRAVLALLPLGQ